MLVCIFQCIYIYIHIRTMCLKKKKVYLCMCVCVEMWMSLSNMLKTANIHQPVSNMTDCSYFSSISTFLAPKAPAQGTPPAEEFLRVFGLSLGWKLFQRAKKANHIVVNF